VDAGLIRGSLLAAAVTLLPGCYYGHLLGGQLDLLSRREPIAKVLADPRTDAALRQKLERALAARAFASRELGLPDNGSYTRYADLERPYAVWNVFAAPELSLTPHEWCYLLVGCLAYRGYYDPERAEAAARELREEGFDVLVAGVPAYSTLGWFDDPLLSTMHGGEDRIAGTIFHELAHQLAFAEGDTAFNESYATFVEYEGLRQYLKDAPELAQQAARRLRWESEYRALMLAARERLQAIYADDAPDGEKRERKRLELERLQRERRELRRAWWGSEGDDAVLAAAGNAQLVPYGLYHQWVPAFARLFEREGGDWRAFHRAVAGLNALGKDERQAKLEELAKGS
jgi:predicted aminopeptidase